MLCSLLPVVLTGLMQNMIKKAIHSMYSTILFCQKMFDISKNGKERDMSAMFHGTSSGHQMALFAGSGSLVVSSLCASCTSIYSMLSSRDPSTSSYYACE